MSIADRIAYQDGSIVSRVLLKGDGGSVTLFAFDAGEGLSEHTSPYEAVVTVLEGAAVVSVGGEETRVEAGGAAVLPAGVPHAVRADERFKMLLVMSRFE